MTVREYFNECSDEDLAVNIVAQLIGCLGSDKEFFESFTIVLGEEIDEESLENIKNKVEVFKESVKMSSDFTKNLIKQSI